MTSKRVQFEAILKKWGYNIFLQRRANAYESESAEYERKLEKHTVRSTYTGKASLQNSAQEEPEGIAHDFDLTFYFKYNANPKRGDRIYESTIEGLDNQVTYLIDIALPMRGIKGEIVYWIVGASEEKVI